jgi:hypothetical protein
MKRLWKSYEIRLLLLFLLLLLVYLTIARLYHEPRGYYGTKEQPRFADPWIPRAETIMDGGLLYRDVFTATPPLINFLLIPPALFSGLFDHLNPWATLSFMLYFSLFNLLGAYVLLYLAENKREGFMAAVCFLLNPLTFGNTVLRRQDESILALFFGISLLFMLRRRHLSAAVAIGATLLIKLSGVLLLPVAFAHSWNWKYIVIPPVIFALALGPFLALAGRDAMFWDPSRERTQHPFKFGGVSLGALWNQFHGEEQNVNINTLSLLFSAGTALTALFILWKRYGVLEDMTILIIVVLLLIPKLHGGYFSLLAITVAPLLKKYRLHIPYFLIGGLVIVADFYKWPIEDFEPAFWMMVVVMLLLAAMLARLCWPRRTWDQSHV